ncbi:unnamed protein product, partial [Polarella glacialis]
MPGLRPRAGSASPPAVLSARNPRRKPTAREDATKHDMPQIIAAAAAAAAAAIRSGQANVSQGLRDKGLEALRQLVVAANADGLQLLRRGRLAAAFEHLKHAEAVLAANSTGAARDGELVALTCQRP